MVKGRKKRDEPRVAVGYCRVSSEDQAREGVSLAAQEARLRAYALATGREMAEVVVDEAESAKTLTRPGLQGILAGIRTGRIGQVVVLKLDRLTRSVRDLADLVELFGRTRTALVSVEESLDGTTASGRLMMNLLASVSQWEREAIGERTSFALRHLRRTGRVYGPVPFGYQREGDRLVPESGEQKALALAREMRAAGATLHAIANRLARSGVRPPRGRFWYPSSVAAVLTSRIAVGR